MKAEIRTRHFTISEEQTESIETALDKLERFCPRPVESMHLTINHDAGHFIADSVLHLKGHEFRAKGEGMEPEYAVIEMVENLRRQLIKYKGKVSARQKGEEGGLGKAMGAVGDLPPLSSTEGFVLKDMDVDAAKATFLAEDPPFLVFRDSQTSKVGVIYRRQDGGIGHMESQES